MIVEIWNCDEYLESIRYIMDQNIDTNLTALWITVGWHTHSFVIGYYFKTADYPICKSWYRSKVASPHVLGRHIYECYFGWWFYISFLFSDSRSTNSLFLSFCHEFVAISIVRKISSTYTQNRSNKHIKRTMETLRVSRRNF